MQRGLLVVSLVCFMTGCSTGMAGPYTASGKVGQSKSTARGLSPQAAIGNLKFKVPQMEVDEKDPLRGTLRTAGMSVAISYDPGDGQPTSTTERIITGGEIRFLREDASSDTWRLDPEEVKSRWPEKKD